MTILATIPKLLLPAALLCLLGSTIYSALALVAALGFVRRRSSRPVEESWLPALSLLKPLHGDEAGLEERLQGFFEQDYPHYEILFCARHPADAGLRLARRVAKRYPRVRAQFLVTGEPAYTNAKVSSLERMALAATSDIFVISDSDVRVRRSYLREVTAPLADAGNGLVTCLYRGVAEGMSFWSRLEATAMSVEMAAGVLVAERIEGMQFALGPTMAVRRGCVDEIGGFGTLGRYCADDFVLGNRIAAQGHRVVLSAHVIDHVILNESFWQSLKHQVRWMKSTRFSRPKGHLGSALTFSVPYGVVVGVSAMLLGRPGLAALAAIGSVATRMLLAGVMARAVVQEPAVLRTMLLYPLRDLMGFGFWVASYAGNTILWRGEVFELLRDGVMRRYSPQPARPAVGEETLLPPRV